MDPLRWQLQFECMVLKWDTPLLHRRCVADHQQTAVLSGTGAYMSERAVLLMENLEEPENAHLSLNDVWRQMLEEAGLTADEGNWCVTVAMRRIHFPGPKKFGLIRCRILWHDAGYPWLE